MYAEKSKTSSDCEKRLTKARRKNRGLNHAQEEELHYSEGKRQ